MTEGLTGAVGGSIQQTDLIEEIEFEIRQWYAGEGTLRECAQRILAATHERSEELGHLPSDVR